MTPTDHSATIRVRNSVRAVKKEMNAINPKINAVP